MSVNYNNIILALRANWNSANAPYPRIDHVLAVTGDTWQQGGRGTGETLTIFKNSLTNRDMKSKDWTDFRYLLPVHIYANSWSNATDILTEFIRVADNNESYFTGCTHLWVDNIRDQSFTTTRYEYGHIVCDLHYINEDVEK